MNTPRASYDANHFLTLLVQKKHAVTEKNIALRKQVTMVLHKIPGIWIKM